MLFLLSKGRHFTIWALTTQRYNFPRDSGRRSVRSIPKQKIESQAVKRFRIAFIGQFFGKEKFVT